MDESDALAVIAYTKLHHTYKRLSNGVQVDWLDNRNYFWGIEYLRHYHECLRVNAPFKIVFAGDSTTHGFAITESAYLLQNLTQSLMTKYGASNGTYVNGGHDGATSEDWIDTFLAQDMAQNPDLYILRYGINDGENPPGPFSQEKVATFKNYLRTGLTTIRSSKLAEQMSIILMSPNSVDDTPLGRDEQWLRAISEVVREAARDFQCAYIDTYSYMEDSRHIVWQDELANGAHVHPLENANALIISLMAPLLIPEMYRKVSGSGITNATTVKQIANPLSSYPQGISLLRASGTGWPFNNGAVYTINQVDGICQQENWSYSGAATKAFRIWDIVTSAWSDWKTI